MKRKLSVITCFCLAFTLLATAQQPTKRILLEDAIASRKFMPETIQEIRSMNDGEHFTTLKQSNCIVRYKYSDGLPVDTLFSLKWFPTRKIAYIAAYEISADESKLLISTDERPIYRHSFAAQYFVYDSKARSLEPLSTNGLQQLATFSPTSDKITFVRDNNLFVSDLKSHIESQVTADGKHNEIINGAPDWVYEEEFSFSKGFNWSPDGKKLAFMRFDEHEVRMFTIPMYDSLYPSLYTYKYPKAGEKNSTVSILVYDVNTGKTNTMDIGQEKDQYIPRIKWTANSDQLGIVRLNRLQNKVDVLVADASTGKSNILYAETNKWFISEIDDNFITFLNDGKRFVVVSECDGYKHLYLYSMAGTLINQITKGKYDIDEQPGIDEVKGLVFYTSAEPSSIDRAVYSIRLDGKGKKLLTSPKGWNSAAFSSNFKYFINTWSDANTPPRYTLHEASGKLIRTLKDNKQVESNMANYGFSRKEFMMVPSPDGQGLNAYIIKPVGFDSTKRYPLFMYVYGGPEAQDVTNKWDRTVAWFQMLAQQGYVVVCVDNRGTNGRGEAFRKSTYMQLGKLEIEDQMNAARYFGSLPFIDKERIGVFGWSYGGYMTCLCLTKGADIFKMGIAVAPVTNWRFYDSVYTERFMRTPQENPSGYDDNSPINFANRLKGKFLLIHGSADDNVHMQNSMVFSEKLIQSGKSFDMAIYPDKNHSIYGGRTRLNLYKKMTDFIIANL